MNYPYANGIIKTLENNILDKSKLIRVAHDSPQAMYKELKEMGYGDNEAYDLESLIVSEFTKLQALFNEIAPKQEPLALLFLSDDAINIKGLLKQKLYNYSFASNYNSNGLFKVDELKNLIFASTPLSNKKYHKFLAPLLKLDKEELNSRALSAKVDNLLYNLAFSLLKSSENQAMYIYFENKIDFTNLISFIRARKLGWDVDEFLLMSIIGGKISVDLLKNLYSLEDKKFLYGLKDYELGKLSSDLSFILERNDLGLLEIYFENRLLQKAKESFADPFTIGPLLYYGLLKKAEAQNIRTIASNPHFDANHLLDY